MITAAVLPEITSALLAELDLRYAVPHACRVCGAPLELANSGERKYACTSDAASLLKNPLGSPGWKPAVDHYRASELYNPPEGDLRVIALITELRRLRELYPAATGGAW